MHLAVLHHHQLAIYKIKSNTVTLGITSMSITVHIQLYDHFISWSYCYTVNRLSVRVCDTVHSGSQGWCTAYRAKSFTSVFLGGMFPFCPFRHFCCRMYRLAWKRTAKKTSRRECEREFFHDHTCIGL